MPGPGENHRSVSKTCAALPVVVPVEATNPRARGGRARSPPRVRDSRDRGYDRRRDDDRDRTYSRGRERSPER